MQLTGTQIRDVFSWVRVESSGDVTLDGCVIDEFGKAGVTLLAGGDLALIDTTVGRVGGNAFQVSGLEGVFALLGYAQGDVTVTGSTSISPFRNV